MRAISINHHECARGENDSIHRMNSWILVKRKCAKSLRCDCVVREMCFRHMISRTARRIWMVLHWDVVWLTKRFTLLVAPSARHNKSLFVIWCFFARCMYAYLVHAHLFESTLKNFEILNVFMLQIGTEFNTFHWDRARKQHIHVLTISGSYRMKWKENKSENNVKIQKWHGLHLILRNV